MYFTLSKSLIVGVVLCMCIVPIRAPISAALKRANAEYESQAASLQTHNDLLPGHDVHGRAHNPMEQTNLYGGMVVDNWEDDTAFGEVQKQRAAAKAKSDRQHEERQLARGERAHTP